MKLNRNRVGASLLAVCLSATALASTAFAATPKLGPVPELESQIWLIQTDREDGDLPELEIDAKAKEYGYKIRLHYDGSTKEITGKAKLNSELPWLDEKLPVREFNKKTYVLSGIKGPNYISDKASENVFDLYYRLDADEDLMPDALQKGSAKKQNFTVKSVYTSSDDTSDTNVTVETVMKDNLTGDQLFDALDIYKTLGDGVYYRLVKIDALSIFVTNESAKNQLTLYYEIMPELPDESYGGNDSGSDNYLTGSGLDVCPINGQPSWICNGTHDHTKLLAELKNQKLDSQVKEKFESSQGSVISGGESDTHDVSDWCDEHGTPGWICAGKH